MEDIIIFAIIAISIVANIVSNFRKEAKKNAKRTIGQPAKATIKNESVKQTKNVKKVYKKPNDSLESIFSMEDMAMNMHQEGTSAFGDSEEIMDADYRIKSIETVISDEDNGHPDFADLLKTPDDFKKAIIYSTILERKF